MSNTRPNNDSVEVSDDELKEAVKDLTPAGTQEIADRVGMSRQGVSYRLQQIEDRYETPWVWSKTIGPTKIWMHADHVFPR
jgi:DNA invertase Pin-like site-specific DNA recombinase